MEYKFIRIEPKDQYAVVNINPTQGFNLLTNQMMEEIVNALEDIDRDETVKVIILRGNDKSFCYGIDMQEFNDFVNDLPKLWDVYRDLFVRLNRIKKLLIAEAAGYSIGFGIEIMLNCDIVIAAESLCLGIPEASLGIIPGLGLSKTLEKVIGKGKAMDMMQAAVTAGFASRIKGVTNDYEATANSDMVVITSGIPRKPGMTREELIGVNAGIVKSVVENVLKYSPNAVILCVSNPMDTMTYLIHKVSGLPKNRIIGMGGALDSSRFKYYLSQALNANLGEVEGFVIGGHGDTTMIPVTRYATYKGIPVSEFLSEETLQKVAADTMVGGATLTGLLGTSAWYAPGAASAAVVEAVLGDQKRMIPCSALLEGEYGESDLCIGVPCVLGRNGIEKVVELKLNAAEKEAFAKSAAAVHKTNAALADALK